MYVLQMKTAHTDNHTNDHAYNVLVMLVSPL